MNTLTLVVSVLLCLTVANGRNFEERNEQEESLVNEDLNEDINRHREHGVQQPRHRRRRWQMGYGYDYPVPQHGYYPERRDYDRNQQDFSRIIKLLEEISTYVRRPQPPPPPQPIYIPYPVPYPIVHRSSCTNKGSKVPNITERFPEMEDTNQNWGFVVSNEQEDDEDYDDGARPISFEPIKPIRPMKRPMPKVDHDKVSTAAPTIADEPKVDKALTACYAATLACCSDKNKRMCFGKFGCEAAYDSGNICGSSAIEAALDSFKQAYAPKK